MGRSRSRLRNVTPRTVVTFYNPIERESRSITVYDGDTAAVARDAADHLALCRRCTKLNDHRHKRRF